jgi:dephospho-CoA kinase
MSPVTASHAEKKCEQLLSKLERWVVEDVIDGTRKSLSGEGGDVTLADMVVMAQVEYMREMYGMDWVAEHGVLRVWCDRAKEEEWVIGREALLEVERTGNWYGVLGA